MGVEVVNSPQSQIAMWEQKVQDLKAGVVKKATLLKWGAAGVLLVLLGPAILTGALAGIAGLLAAVIDLVLVTTTCSTYEPSARDAESIGPSHG